jgi:hypothetical protein
MNEDSPIPPGGEFKPPVSTFAGPIAELVGHGMLAPPSRPGLLATLDGFEITRILGAGGMGVVLLARDATNGSQVAIKMIRPELLADRGIVRRFLKEAGHLQRLKHPNVVEVSAVLDREQGPCFVMPYFERGSLAGRIRPGEPLPEEAAIDLSTQVCEALQFAHRRGIIHRDLKPANILLAQDGRACLADFGLARTLFNDSIVDVENQQCEGTAPYMSPGVAAGNAEDTRCDIYSFGALLYEMLTGEPPYKGRTTKEIREQILAHAPPAILDLNPKADPGLVTIAEAAMARELRDRYADIGDALADLKRVKDGGKPLGSRGGLRGNLDKARAFPALVWVPAGIVLVVALIWVLARRQPSGGENPQRAFAITNSVGTNQTAANSPPAPVPPATNAVQVITQVVVVTAPQTDLPIAPESTQAVFQAASPSPAIVEYVREALAPYGKWLEIAPYGSCWRPTAAVTDPKWRPYEEQGRWLYTAYGWFWHSDYSWGQITFHYGRWIENEGCWVWVPGYDWASAWVCWREAEGYLGWAPLPPAAVFQPGTGLIWDGKPASDADSGLGADAFTFVATDHFWDRNLHGAVAPRDQVETIFKGSTVKNGYRMEQGKFIIAGPGRDHVAAVTQHDVKVESAVVRPLNN